MKKTILIFYLLSVASVSLLQAQTPSDAVMMKPRQSCFAFTYEHGSFDHYWEGPELRDNATIATVSRNVVTPMIAVGVLDKLNLLIGVPYVKTESAQPNGGRFQGAKGFQDLLVALKYRTFEREMVSGKFSTFVTAGYATPVTNYLSDYRPYSIGNGTNEWSLRAIAQYKLNMGLYGRIVAGHFFRGQTKAERDYYYNNGSYYTPWMDVPSAWEYGASCGVYLLNNALKVECTFYGQQSTSGDDIRKYNAAQPTNKVNFGQAALSAQYFVKGLQGFGVLAYYTHVVSGRNMPQLTALGAGATYQFSL